MNQSRKYRLKSVVVDAVQWFKNGDHPEDDCFYIDARSTNRYLSEGKIVRYYRTPDLDGQVRCAKCGTIMHFHGWIDTGKHGLIVCPGDWIIKDNGEFYSCEPDIFEADYEKIEDDEKNEVE